MWYTAGPAKLSFALIGVPLTNPLELWMFAMKQTQIPTNCEEKTDVAKKGNWLEMRHLHELAVLFLLVTSFFNTSDSIKALISFQNIYN